jgi:hypothetical protein
MVKEKHYEILETRFSAGNGDADARLAVLLGRQRDADGGAHYMERQIAVLLPGLEFVPGVAADGFCAAGL